MERISVMKVVTYLPDNIKVEIATNTGKQVSTITDKEIIECAWKWAYNEFGSTEGLIMIDEEGNQL